MPLVIRVSGGEEAPRTIEVQGDRAIIGKHSECEVILRHAMVSRRHLALAIENGGIYVEDLGSTNGTKLAGKPLAGRSPLASGQEITIGPFRLDVEARVAKEAPSIPEPPPAPIPAPPPEPPPVAESLEASQAATALAAPAKPAKKAAPQVAPADQTVTVSASPAVGGSIAIPALAPFFADPSVSEVMVNGAKEVFIERGGKLELTTARFASEGDLIHVIQEIGAAVGRVVDDSQPMLDARLGDGSRVNAVLPPLAVRGPYLTIRRFPPNRQSAEDLVRLGALNERMLDFLKSAVAARLSVLVSGGAGSGKTTLLNALCAFVGASERVITIEDAAELQLPQRHVLPLETRPPDADGEREITVRDLERNALRMRPDRIVVGEVRGGEALDMLQALNTGHEGSLTTIHANSPREALSRLETLVLFAGAELPARAIREQIAGAIRLIVQMSRGGDGRRLVTSVSEVTGMEGEQFTIGEIFRWQTAAGKAGGHEPTGYVPRCRETMQARGVTVDNGWFQP